MTSWLILIAGALLLIGALSSKLSERIGVPFLLLFLAVGMLAGSEGIGGIQFDSSSLAANVGTVALLVILFAGGLDTEWKSVKSVLGVGIVLSTFGVIFSTLLLGTFAWFVLGTFSTFSIGATGLTWLEALLLAAIVSSTDAAAVFSVYRTSKVQPIKRIRHLLEFESGSNDPMAVLLTTAILGIMTQGHSTALGLVATLSLQYLVGGAVGLLVGMCGVWVINKITFSAQGLYPIIVLSLGLLAFGLAEMFSGNGYLAVYIAGLVIGNCIKKARLEVLNFHDGLSWLMQIVMFVILGLLVFPSRLLPVAVVATVLALFLMFIARPVGVLLCMLPFRTKMNEMGYISWVGLRGSVPIVLATFPAAYGIKGADDIFNIVFFIVITSVLIQGLTLVPAAC